MTRKSRTLNRRIELWGTAKVSDGFGGSTVSKSKVKDIWSRVENISFQNYDSIGASIDRNARRVIIREAVDTNINFFVIDGKEYQINDVESNYKKSQYECVCEAI